MFFSVKILPLRSCNAKLVSLCEKEKIEKRQSRMVKGIGWILIARFMHLKLTHLPK
jgi:hypothetical protein